jgi:hypothetical protein
MRAVLLFGEALQQRQREARGLAGAGLRGAEQVASRENDRDGLQLDGGGLGIALVRDCAEELRAKPERFERTSNWNFSCTRPGKGEPLDRFRQMLF